MLVRSLDDGAGHLEARAGQLSEADERDLGERDLEADVLEGPRDMVDRGFVARRPGGADAAIGVGHRLERSQVRVHAVPVSDELDGLLAGRGEG